MAAVLPYGRLHFEKVEETDWRQYSEKIRMMLDAHLEVTGLKTVCKLRSLSDAEFWGDFGEVEDLATAAVRKLAELKKETSERVGKNAAMYERFSDRVKELIKAFSAGLIDAAEVLIETEALAKAVLAADEAHVDSGLNKRAFGIAAILLKFSGHVATVAETGAVYGGEGHEHGDSSDSSDSNGDSGGDDGGAALEALHQAAAEIDAIYASDVEAPAYWQDKPTLKKELRGQVRRLIQKLGLTGWQSEVPKAVEDYALRHYGKP